MKLVKKIALGACALALCGLAFVGCSNSSDSSFGTGLPLSGATSSSNSGNDNSASLGGADAGALAAPASGQQTIQYTTVFEGSTALGWLDAEGVKIEKTQFTEDFDSLKLTFNATAGALKLAVCEPWGEITDATISDGSEGSFSNDGALTVPTGDDKTVTVKLSAASVAGIKGSNDAAGGLKIMGADTITLKKVESFKAPAVVVVPQPQTQQPQQTQTQTQTSSAATEVWSETKALGWGDSDGVVIDHAKFPADFNSIRVTLNATSGGFKMAGCDPWTPVKVSASSVSGAGVDSSDPEVMYPATGDAQVITVKLSANEVAKIKGDEGATGWGGLKIFGDTTITVTKVEALKQ